jgi:hypothetical protein
MTSGFEYPAGFVHDKSELRMAWIMFASAAVSGLNAFGGTQPNGNYLSDDECVDRAAEQADRMLAELKKRLTA